MNFGYITVAGNIYERRRQDNVPAASAQFYAYLMPLANHVTYQIGLPFTDIAYELGLSRQIVSKHVKILHEKKWLTHTKNHPAYPAGLLQLHVALWDLEKKKRSDYAKQVIEKVKKPVAGFVDTRKVNSQSESTQSAQVVNDDVKNLNSRVTSPLPLRGQPIAGTQSPSGVGESTSTEHSGSIKNHSVTPEFSKENSPVPSQQKTTGDVSQADDTQPNRSLPPPNVVETAKDEADERMEALWERTREEREKWQDEQRALVPQPAEDASEETEEVVDDEDEIPDEYLAEIVAKLEQYGIIEEDEEKEETHE